MAKRKPRNKASGGVTKGSVKSRGKGRAKTSKESVESAEKQRKALELRKAGHTLQEIADELGYSHASGAHKALTSALHNTLREPAAAVRTLETERLDALFKRAWDQIEDGAPLGGDRGVGSFVLRLMDRRAKLLGLDAPIKQHHQVAARIMRAPVGELCEKAAEALREVGATVIPPPDGWPKEMSDGN